MREGVDLLVAELWRAAMGEGKVVALGRMFSLGKKKWTSAVRRFLMDSLTWTDGPVLRSF